MIATIIPHTIVNLRYQHVS